MKTVVTGIVLGIVFSITLFFVNRAFASDAPVSIRYPCSPHICNHRSTADITLTDELRLP
jgi:hypothetical protein